VSGTGASGRGRGRGQQVLLGLGAAAALAAPLVLSDLTFFVTMVLSAIVVTGLSLLMGYAGQASLGQGAFLAVGSLTVAVLTTKAGVPPLLALLAAPVLSALFALVVGVPLLRLRGHYLAFGTLALLLIVTGAMSSIDLFGGPYGISGIPAFGIGGWTIGSQRQYAYLALICLAVVLVVTRNAIHSRFGRGIRALAGTESAAESAGVAVMQDKLAVFALSAAFAGLAGGVSVFFTPFVNPDSFPPLASFSYVVMAVIGGLGTLYGGVLGAVLVSSLMQGLNWLSTMPSMPPTAAPVLQYAGYAVVLVAALLYLPRGLAPTLAALPDLFRARAARTPRAARPRP
jgi:branched-chain amino acid transport system permease protein